MMVIGVICVTKTFLKMNMKTMCVSVEITSQIFNVKSKHPTAFMLKCFSFCATLFSMFMVSYSSQNAFQQHTEKVCPASSWSLCITG